MKQILIFLTAILYCWNSNGQDINKAYKTKQVTFLGLDYSAAVFIGSRGFKDPAELSLLPDSWNSLFSSEPEKYDVQKAFATKMTYRFDIVKQRNNSVDYSERITDKQLLLPHLTKEDLQTIISGYPEIKENGVALVFIVDAYNKIEPKAYYHIVFFDMQTNHILLTYLDTEEPGGGGLRNYWANSFYRAILNAGRHYKTTAEFYRYYTK